MKTTIQTPPVRHDFSILSPDDLHLFNEGSNYRMYSTMGAHPAVAGDEPGTSFSVWAPNAREVTVMGDFNHWDPRSHRLQARGSSGIWEGFLPGVGKGALYKYHIVSHHHGHIADKADPLAFYNEKPPRT